MFSQVHLPAVKHYYNEGASRTLDDVREALAPLKQ